MEIELASACRISTHQQQPDHEAFIELARFTGGS
jgi:hypothetical protein